LLRLPLRGILTTELAGASRLQPGPRRDQGSDAARGNRILLCESAAKVPAETACACRRQKRIDDRSPMRVRG